MAISTVSPFGNRRKQSEETVAFDQQLTRLEDDIRKLKIEFDIYFNGTSKRPPFEARARIEARVS